MTTPNRRLFTPDGRLDARQLMRLEERQRQTERVEYSGATYSQSSAGTVVASSIGGGGAFLQSATILSPSPDLVNLYDATLMTPVANTVSFQAGPAIWAWNPYQGPLNVLTRGFLYPLLGQNGSYSATPPGGGSKQLRGLYIVLGGWVYGGGQCLPNGTGITLLTY